MNGVIIIIRFSVAEQTETMTTCQISGQSVVSSIRGMLDCCE